MDHENSKLDSINKGNLIKKHFNEIDSISKGHFNYIAKQIVTEIIKNSSDETSNGLSKQIEEAISFLEDLRNEAINRYAKLTGNDPDPKARNSILYDDRDWIQAMDYWYAIKYETSAISLGDLESMISNYLNVSWSSETLEWFMINSYLKQNIYEATQFSIKHYGIFSLKASIYLAGNKKWIYELLKLILFQMHGDWILYILTPIFFFKHGLDLLDNEQLITGAGIVILTTFITLNCLLSLPAKIINRHKMNKQIKKIIDLKSYVSGYTWSPLMLKRKIENTNLTETFYPFLIPLLEKMIKRNPNIFNIKGGYKFDAFAHLGQASKITVK